MKITFQNQTVTDTENRTESIQTEKNTWGRDKIQRNKKSVNANTFGAVYESGQIPMPVGNEENNKGKSLIELQQDAGNTNVALQQDYMTLLSHTMSQEDYAKACEDGFDPRELDQDTAVTIVDRIKAELVRSGQNIAGYTDDIDLDTLAAAVGSDTLAQSIEEQFRATDIPLTPENVDEKLGDVSGILVPGGFGSRGVEGKILAAQYAREHKVPYLGLCLGMQVAIIEFARHVCGFNDAHSVELDPNTTHPVIALMPDQNGVEDIGGTLRLGSYPCILDKTSKAYELYGTENIEERHRHRYEVNNDFRAVLTEHGMKLCGTSPDGRIVEMVELPDHPWFIATQAHPELKSRPNRPHPLFHGFVEAATKCKR